MALINCDECGAEISSKATACPKCGNPTHATTSGISTVPVNASPGASPPKPSPGRKLGSAVAIFFIAVIAFLVFEGRSSDKPVDNTTTTDNGVASASQTPDTTAADAASTAAATAQAAASAAAAQEVDKKCAANLQCVADKYDATANAQCEGTIEDHAKEIAKWDYKVGGEHWYTPFTSKISWGDTAHRRIVYYGDEAKFQNGFGAWQRQSYWCVFDIASQKVTDAKFDAEGFPPLEDDAASGTQAPASSAVADVNASDSVAGVSGSSQQPASGTATTFNTSFDCAKARSDSEHLVCGDAEIAADDVELAGLYAKAKAVATDQAAFKEHVRQQWNYRERTCHDRDCLVQWYADQKQRFTNILAQASEAGAGQANTNNHERQPAPTSGPTASYPTSFDCSAPTLLDEKSICGDPGLAAMDIEMAAQYAAAVKRAADPAKLQTDQNDWLAVRRDCAGDLNCLRHAYGVRIDQLRRSS